MNITALVIGFLTTCLIIYKFNHYASYKRHKAYVVLLATFPVYYWIFALYARDSGALINEIIAGVAFFVTAALAYKYGSIKGLIILAIGFVAHGIYDVVHLSLYPHSVAPIWWPEFCGSVDILLGIYMLYLVKTFTYQQQMR